MTPEPSHLHQPVLAVARKDVATLRADFTVQQALERRGCSRWLHWLPGGVTSLSSRGKAV